MPSRTSAGDDDDAGAADDGEGEGAGEDDAAAVAVAVAVATVCDACGTAVHPVTITTAAASAHVAAITRSLGEPGAWGSTPRV